MLHEIVGLNFLCYNSSNWANISNSHYEVLRIYVRATEVGGPGQVTLKCYVAVVMAGIVS